MGASRSRPALPSSRRGNGIAGLEDRVARAGSGVALDEDLPFAAADVDPFAALSHTLFIHGGALATLTAAAGIGWALGRRRFGPGFFQRG